MLNRCLRLVVSGLLPVFACLSLSTFLPAQDPQMTTMRVYFGTYTNGASKGIYTATLDLASGELSEPELAAELANPSFVAISPDHRYLYCVNEVADLPGPRGQKVGGVTAFSLDPKSGQLTKLNSQLSAGAGPCHLCVDQTGKCVVVANYGGGSVASLPVDEDGSLKEAATFIQHIGSSVNPNRQAGPHAHSANIAANNKYVVVADLGADKLFVYRFDAAKATLTPNTPPSVSTHPGAGPRHFSFHPNGKFAYSNNEMESSVTAYQYDAKNGELHSLMTHTTLPVDYDKPGNSTAECLVHPSGKFVYVSNRGHNSIAMFKILDDGTLQPIGHQSTQGEIPRNFGIDPTGKYLLAANQNSNTVVIFEIDPARGTLKPTGTTVNVPSPVCVRMLAID